MTAKLRLSFLANKRPPNNRCEFNSEKLKDPKVQAAFDLNLSNRFAELLDEASITNKSVPEQIQSRADALESALIETSHNILGKRIRSKQPHWVTENSLQLINKQEEAKKSYKRKPTPARKQQWLDLQKQVTASIQRDEDAHLDT